MENLKEWFADNWKLIAGIGAALLLLVFVLRRGSGSPTAPAPVFMPGNDGGDGLQGIGQALQAQASALTLVNQRVSDQQSALDQLLNNQPKTSASAPTNTTPPPPPPSTPTILQPKAPETTTTIQASAAAPVSTPTASFSSPEPVNAISDQILQDMLRKGEITPGLIAENASRNNLALPSFMQPPPSPSAPLSNVTPPLIPNWPPKLSAEAQAIADKPVTAAQIAALPSSIVPKSEPAPVIAPVSGSITEPSYTKTPYKATMI